MAELEPKPAQKRHVGLRVTAPERHKREVVSTDLSEDLQVRVADYDVSSDSSAAVSPLYIPRQDELSAPPRARHRSDSGPWLGSTSPQSEGGFVASPRRRTAPHFSVERPRSTGTSPLRLFVNAREFPPNTFKRKHGRALEMLEAWSWKHIRKTRRRGDVVRPRNAALWSVDHVVDWLHTVFAGVGEGVLARIAEEFRTNLISGAMLLRLNDRFLETELHVKSAISRLRILSHLDSLRPSISHSRTLSAGVTHPHASVHVSHASFSTAQEWTSLDGSPEPLSPALAERLNIIRARDLVDVKPWKEGQFGVVFRATWKTKGNEVEVILKVDKAETPDWNELRTNTDVPPHHNILSLLGICLDFGTSRRVALVTEFVQLGSLKDVFVDPTLAAARTALELDSPETLLNCALGIARGLTHLHAHNVVHRDLALRNVLVRNDGAPVVCDFGLARVVDGHARSYYRVSSEHLLPLRWMSPESITTGKFSKKSDVWMFGVTLWELMHKGTRTPYPEEVNSIQLIAKRAMGALSLEMPEWVTEELPGLSSLVSSCWRALPNERPSMRDVCASLTKLASTMSHQPRKPPPPLPLSPQSAMGEDEKHLSSYDRHVWRNEDSLNLSIPSHRPRAHSDGAFQMKPAAPAALARTPPPPLRAPPLPQKARSATPKHAIVQPRFDRTASVIVGQSSEHELPLPLAKGSSRPDLIRTVSMPHLPREKKKKSGSGTQALRDVTTRFIVKNVKPEEDPKRFFGV